MSVYAHARSPLTKNRPREFLHYKKAPTTGRPLGTVEVSSGSLTPVPPLRGSVGASRLKGHYRSVVRTQSSCVKSDISFVGLTVS